MLNTWTKNDKGIKKIIKKLVLVPTVKKWKSVFESYLETNINLSSKKYECERDLISYPVQADIFCTGGVIKYGIAVGMKE